MFGSMGSTIGLAAKRAAKRQGAANAGAQQPKKQGGLAGMLHRAIESQGVHTQNYVDVNQKPVPVPQSATRSTDLDPTPAQQSNYVDRVRRQGAGRAASRVRGLWF